MYNTKKQPSKIYLAVIILFCTYNYYFPTIYKGIPHIAIIYIDCVLRIDNKRNFTLFNITVAKNRSMIIKL